MGADFCAYTLAISDEKEPNWNVEITDEVVKVYLRDYLGFSEEEIAEGLEEHRADIKSAIDQLKSGWENEGDCCKIHFPMFHCYVFTTGGMTWGDAPTETYETISVLASTDLLEQMGFIY